MILKFSSSSFKYAGRVNGEIWTSSNLRGIGRMRNRPNPRTKKLRFVPLFTLEEGHEEWANLDQLTQADWETLAAATFGWPLQGSPRYLTGREYFSNYYTVLRLIDPSAAVPDVPPSGPIWQTKPKFFEFAEFVGGDFTLKAETEFDAGTVLLFSGLPPTRIGFKPDFSLEEFIGSHTFEYGLTPNETWSGIDAMMETAFGPIENDQKIWGRVWEVQDGYIRTLVDPCNADPDGEAPPADTSFEYQIFNDYFENVSGGGIFFYFDSSTQIGEIDISGLGAFDTQTGTVNLIEGYETSDVNEWSYGGQWDDTIPFGGGETEAPALDPFELTLSIF